jgi:hypothetical protein
VIEDFSGYVDSATAAKWTGNYVALQLAMAAVNPTWTRTANALTGKTSAPNRATFYGTQVGENQPNRTLWVPFATTNKIDVTFRGMNNFGITQPDSVAFTNVYVLGSALGSSYVRAYITNAGQNVFLNVAVRTAGADEVILVTSPAIPSGSASASTSDDFRIVLDASQAATASGLITATMYWPTKAANDSRWTTGVQVTCNSTSLLANTCIGFGMAFNANGATIGTTGTVITNVVAVSYTKLVPLSPSSLLTISKTDTQSPPPSRYFVPAGVKAFDLNPLTNAFVLTQQSGAFSQGGVPAFPAVDTTGVQIIGSGSDTRVDGMLTSGSLSASVVYGLETKANNSSTTGDYIGFICRLSSDLKNMLVFVPSGGTSSNAESKTITSMIVIAVVNGVRFQLLTKSYGTNSSQDPSPYVLDSTTWMRWVDDGTTVTLYANNLVIFQFNPSTAGNWVSSGASTACVGNRIAANIQGNTCNTCRFIFFGNTGTVNAQDSLLIVSGGSVFRANSQLLVQPGSGAGAVSAGLFDVMAQAAFSKIFLVDGTFSRYYDLTLDSLLDWGSHVTSGSLPQQCTLIALYRGRLVLSGKASDKHNWFMSKLGDPFNWNYSPATPTVLDAVAGNLSQAGLIGDVITALIPINDDVMYFGCNHSIWKMTGDPAAGGTIDQVSDLTGIAFGRAWAKDPSGTLYFWGTDGIYRLQPGGLPENITKGRIDVRLRSIDMSTHRVFMAWDYLRATLLVLIAPTDGVSANRILAYESRVDAWWEDTDPNTSGSVTVLFPYDSQVSGDQRFILGSRDGFIRQIDEAAADDDGTAIPNHVRFAPFIAPTHGAEVVLKSILPILGQGSGTVNMNIYTGQSAEDCQRSVSPRVSRALAHASRSHAMRQKVRGYAVQLELSQTSGTRWATEGMTLDFEEGGMPRREIRA